MKRLLKYLTVMLTILSCSTNKVEANAYNDYMIKKYDKVPDVYVTKLGPVVNTYDYMYIIARASDNQFVYCIQPGVSINEETLYEGFTYNQESVTQLTQEQWQRITLLSYYGYGYVDDYVNHTDKKWYAVTQFLIWQVAPFGQDIFFADRLQGKRIDIFQEEMAELNRLVDNHLVRPSFSNTSKDMVIGETFNLTDNNSVLANYDIESVSNNISVSKNLNNLSITAKGVGSAKLTLTRNSTKYTTPPIIYNAPDSQRVMARGNADPLKINLNINIVGGKVSINKLDSDTNSTTPQLSDGILSGAIYDVYDENYNLITSLTTDKNAYAESENILAPNKTYILKERTSSKGYLLDTTEYKFSLSNNNLHVHLNVKENIIKRKVDLFKVYASNETGIMTPEPNITFDIYLKSNNKYYSSITTNRSGFATINLPYGTWIFKQKNSTQYYEKVEDFEVIIQNNNSEPITKIISNAEITSKLKVVKVDENSQKVLVRDGIKFQIRNTDTNEFVCQHITYPIQTNLCVFETSGGTFTTPYALSLGNYEIIELEDQVIDGYVWNSKPLKFSINENSNFIYDKEFGVMLEVKFENKQVKGEVEILKYGEDYKIEDNKFIYEEILLNDVSYNLYAYEDIYSQDGTLIYNKDTLIGTYKTINGKFIIDNMFLGKYKLVETSTDENHLIDSEEHIFEIKYEDQYTDIVKLSFTFKNYLKKGNLEFTKVDSINNKPLENTIIEIYMYDGEEETLIGTYTTSDKGKVIINDIPIINGIEYYLVEKSATTGYVLNTEKIYFELENNKTTEITMKNDIITSDLEFIKIDSITNEILANAKIEIYNADTNVLVFSGITTNQPLTIENIKFGKYYIIEIEAPASYKLFTEKIYFEVSENDEIIKISMPNEKIKGTLEFTKLDLSTSNPIPNTLIEIYTINDELVFSGRTDLQGKIIIDELLYGKYYILERETGTPDYILNTEKMYFEILEDGEVVKATMTNEKMIIEIPKTEKNDYIIPISFILMGIATSIVVYDKIKNKKNR